MFQFPRFPPPPYRFRWRSPGITPAGLLHSGTPGSSRGSRSPGHFAASPRPSSAVHAKASTARPSTRSLPVRGHHHRDTGQESTSLIRGHQIYRYCSNRAPRSTSVNRSAEHPVINVPACGAPRTRWRVVVRVPGAMPCGFPSPPRNPSLRPRRLLVKEAESPDY